jgi:hypothetical protein
VIWPGKAIYARLPTGVAKDMGKRFSQKVTANGRLTIPSRFRDYFDMPDPEENDVWLDIEIHGLDGNKHPDHPFATDEEER